MLARWKYFIAAATLVLLLSSSLMVGGALEGAENDGYALEVSVMDSGSGLPVKAFITIFSGNDIAAKLETSDSGAARVILSPGDYSYSLEARGYQPVKGRFSILDAAVALTISMEKTPNEVSTGVLQAHLVDAVNNIPVIGVMTIYGPDGQSPTFKSDGRGFVKAELALGEYKYGAEARGYEPVRGSLVLKEATLEIRVPMKPSSGGEDPEPEPYGVIFGTVMGPGKEPVAGAAVNINGMVREPFPVDPTMVNADGTMPPGNTFSAFMERVETDREGHFKVKAPFGPYEIMVEARGYLPFFTSVVVSREQSEVRVPIMLERMPDEPPFPDMRRAVIDLSYADQDSDGNPEKFHLMMDLDGDMVPELEVSMVDRNSDGDPEELNVHSSLPPPVRMRIMDIIMMLMDDPPVLPFPDSPGDDEGWWEGDDDGDGTAPKVDWDELLRKLMDGETDEEVSEDIEDGPEPIDEQTGEEDGASGSTVSDKEGGGDEGPSYLMAAGAVTAIFLLILIVLSLGVVLRMGRKD